MRSVRPLALTALLTGAACTPAPGFHAPPQGSFAVETHQFTIGDTTASLPGATVTKDFFPDTRAAPLFGRFFIDSDFVAVAPATIVLSDQLWTARFDASPTILGRTIEIDGRRWLVVGIAPKGFDVPQGAQFWMPKRS